jgi:hypothetical protein
MSTAAALAHHADACADGTPIAADRALLERCVARLGEAMRLQRAVEEAQRALASGDAPARATSTGLALAVDDDDGDVDVDEQGIRANDVADPFERARVQALERFLAHQRSMISLYRTCLDLR